MLRLRLQVKLEVIKPDDTLHELMGEAQAVFEPTSTTKAVELYNDLATKLMNESSESKAAQLLDKILDIMQQKERWTIFEIARYTQSDDSVYTTIIHALRFLSITGEIEVFNADSVSRTYGLKR